MWFVFGTSCVKCEDWEWRLVLCQVRDCSCHEVRTGRWGKAQEVEVWWLLVHSTDEEKKIKGNKGKINVTKMIVQESDIFDDFLHRERTSWIIFVKATGQSRRVADCKTGSPGRVVGKALSLCREMQQDLWLWSECGGPQGIHSWRVLVWTTGSWIYPQLFEKKGRKDSLPGFPWVESRAKEWIPVPVMTFLLLFGSQLFICKDIPRNRLRSGEWKVKQQRNWGSFQETSVSVDKIFLK